MCELRGQKGEHTYTWVANVRMTNMGVGKVLRRQSMDQERFRSECHA